MTNSNSKHRVLIEPDVFGKSVAGTRTGRTMSTPDAHKPELHEIDLDGSHGLVWLPDVVFNNMTYTVSVTCQQESFESPTEAVLAMLDWLRSGQTGGITFRVECDDDNVHYQVEADQHSLTDWSATVVEANAPNYAKNGHPREARPDLIPTEG